MPGEDRWDNRVRMADTSPTPPWTGGPGADEFALAASIERSDPARAVELYDLAAAKGGHRANFFAGQLLYEQGDREGARLRFERGAASGEPLAMLGLGRWNLVRFRLRESFQWYCRYLRAGAFARSCCTRLCVGDHNVGLRPQKPRDGHTRMALRVGDPA